MNHKKTINLLIFILAISSTAFGQQINLTGQQPGVIDLTVVAALHPLMSLYDFNRMSFVNIEFGLDARAWHEQRQKLLKAGAEAKNGLEDELAAINKKYSELKQKQFILMNDLQKSTDEKQQEELRFKTEEMNRQIIELWQKRNLISFRLAHPDLMLPEQTAEMLRRIEREIQETIEKVAEDKGFTLVLNASVPNSGRRNLQRSFEILTDSKLSHAETDLYYAFLANSPETAQQKSEREHAASGIKEQSGAARWLEESRQPAVQEQLPINPHPLVLKGGIDMTTDVVTSLLKRYKCDDEVISRLAAILHKRTGRQ
jgi:Skp family chaperone for outer membrane proteins